VSEKSGCLQFTSGGRKIGFSPRAPRLRVNRGFACSKDVRRSVRRGVRRRDRGQRPTATKDPNTKQRRRRQSRHCSRVRRPRFPHVAPRPHPSRHGSESASSHPAPCQKDVRRDVRRRDRGQRPTATVDPNTKPLRKPHTRIHHHVSSKGHAIFIL
jgi:hypothetical protein